MKMLTDEKRQNILDTVLNDTSKRDFQLFHITAARKLIEFCCFEPEIFTNDFGTRMTFKEGEEELVITCDGASYRIGGCSLKHHSGYPKSWKIDVMFPMSYLHVVINEIKMFYMGNPQDCVLFTGAFCPPHIGHRSLIERSINDGYDYAIVAVSNQTFLEKKFSKAHESSGIIYSEEQRINMMLAMTYDIPNVLIYGAERGYTYEVLCDVKKKYDIPKLSFACGSDKLKEVNRWGFHDKLLTEYGFYILQRGEDHYDDIVRECNNLFSRYKIVRKAPDYADVSSTQIREHMKDGSDYDGLVTKKVAELLKKL